MEGHGVRMAEVRVPILDGTGKIDARFWPPEVSDIAATVAAAVEVEVTAQVPAAAAAEAAAAVATHEADTTNVHGIANTALLETASGAQAKADAALAAANGYTDTKTGEITGLPDQTGHTGKVLQTDGSQASWQVFAAGATGGGSDQVFYAHGTTVTTDYAIPSGENAVSVGPITVNAGITVTVPTGSVWAVI